MYQKGVQVTKSLDELCSTRTVRGYGVLRMIQLGLEVARHVPIVNYRVQKRWQRSLEEDFVCVNAFLNYVAGSVLRNSPLSIFIPYPLSLPPGLVSMFIEVIFKLRRGLTITPPMPDARFMKQNVPEIQCPPPPEKNMFVPKHRIMTKKPYIAKAKESFRNIVFCQGVDLESP